MLSRINEEFHSTGSGLCDNCPRRRLEVRKIIYAISDCANLCLKRESVSRERASSIDNSCKRSEKYFRCSRSQMFFKTGVLKNFANFTGKHLGWSLFLLKLQACNLVKCKVRFFFYMRKDSTTVENSSCENFDCIENGDIVTESLPLASLLFVYRRKCMKMLLKLYGNGICLLGETKLIRWSTSPTDPILSKNRKIILQNLDNWLFLIYCFLLFEKKKIIIIKKRNNT